MLQLGRNALERERLRPEPARELLAAIGAPVRHERDPRPAREQVASGELADLPGPDEQDRAAGELSEDLLR